jgi:Mn2+/Fe2+ NRAMP family transporter
LRHKEALNMAVLKLLFVLPLAAVLLAFAFANRGWVTVGFDPTGQNLLAPLEAPQYAVIFAAAALGAVVGGFVTWLGQGARRRAARLAEAEVMRLRQELQAARITAPAALVRA